MLDFLTQHIGEFFGRKAAIIFFYFILAVLIFVQIDKFLGHPVYNWIKGPVFKPIHLNHLLHLQPIPSPEYNQLNGVIEGIKHTIPFRILNKDNSPIVIESIDIDWGKYDLENYTGLEEATKWLFIDEKSIKDTVGWDEFKKGFFRGHCIRLCEFKDIDNPYHTCRNIMLPFSLNPLSEKFIKFDFFVQPVSNDNKVFWFSRFSKENDFELKYHKDSGMKVDAFIDLYKALIPGFFGIHDIQHPGKDAVITFHTNKGKIKMKKKLYVILEGYEVHFLTKWLKEDIKVWKRNNPNSDLKNYKNFNSNN